MKTNAPETSARAIRNLAENLARHYTGTSAPRFGMESEQTVVDGNRKPIGKAAAGEIFRILTQDHGYAVHERNGQGEIATIRRAGDGSLFCFELYASVIEMAGGTFPAGFDGLRAFLGSVDRYGHEFGSALGKLGLSALPVDFDTLNAPEDYRGTDAPLRPHAHTGHQLAYYRAHPELDSVTERGMISTHFSMGYTDSATLKRMIRVLTALGPGLAAAFSTAAPAVLLEHKKRSELMDARLAEGMKGEKTHVLVPRITAWALGAPTRSGMPKGLVKAAFGRNSTLADVIQAVGDFDAIVLTPPDALQSFNRAALAANAGVEDYLKHNKTLWTGFRADLNRLESREAGSGLYKCRTGASLLIPALMNPDILSRLERYINQSGLKAKDVYKARKNAQFEGLDARMGDSTVRNVTHEMTDIVKQGLPRDLQNEIRRLEDILEAGSDSEIIARHPEALEILMQTPFAERRQPLASFFKPRATAEIIPLRIPKPPSRKTDSPSARL